MTRKIGLFCGFVWCLGCSQSVNTQTVPSAVEPTPVLTPTLTIVRQALVKVPVGTQQPLQRLTDIDGNLIDLQQPHKRKLIIFFATWCGDSKRLMQQLQTSPLLNDPQLLIVAIGREENQHALQQFKAEYKLPLHFVADPDRAFYQQFTDKGIPRVVLVNEQNLVVKTFLGEIPSAIDEIVWP